TAGHEADLGRVVDDLIHRHGDEIHQHDFRHRTHAGNGSTYRGTDNGLLGDGSGAHAGIAELRRQTLGHGHHAAAFGIGDILAKYDDVLVLLHGFEQR